MAKQIKKYFFIDECGDPEFYGKGKKLLVGQQGYQPLLIIGMIRTHKRNVLRKQVLAFQQEILADPMYNTIPSLNKKGGWFLHAKDDHPEVRVKFFEKLRRMSGFKAYMIVGRKDLNIFNKKHNNNASEFYFDMLHHLLKKRIYKGSEVYQIFLAHREKTTMPKFTAAIEKTIKKQEEEIELTYKYDIVKSKEFPEMSVVDYMIWALQRYINKGEGRFFEALKNKYSLIIDLYDFDNYDDRKNYYWKGNPFSLGKATDFGILETKKATL